MKHNELLERLVAEAKNDPNTLGFLVFGSVASGTQREDSDIDVITALRANKPLRRFPICCIRLGKQSCYSTARAR